MTLKFCNILVIIFALLLSVTTFANGPVNGKNYLFHWMSEQSMYRFMNSPGFGTSTMPLKKFGARKGSNPNLLPVVVQSYPELSGKPGLFTFDHLIGGMTADTAKNRLDNYARFNREKGIFPTVLMMQINDINTLRIGEIRSLTRFQTQYEVHRDMHNELSHIPYVYPRAEGDVSSYDLLWHRIIDRDTGHTYYREMIVLNPENAIRSYTVSSQALQDELRLAIQKLSDPTYRLSPHKWHHVVYPEVYDGFAQGNDPYLYNRSKRRRTQFIPALEEALNNARELDRGGQITGHGSPLCQSLF